jgi:hypothetical protein
MQTIKVSELSKTAQQEVRSDDTGRQVYALKSGRGHKLLFVESQLEALLCVQKAGAIERGDLKKVVNG